MVMPLHAALARLDLFSAAAPEDLDAIAALAVERTYADGDSVFLRGAQADGMLVILQGRIRLSIISPEGRELILREAEAGSVIGEIAVLDGGRRTADAVANGSVITGFISQAAFSKLLEDRPALQNLIMHVLCARLRETTDQLESIALYPLEARLARFLLWQLKHHGRMRQDGAHVVSLTFSQSAIASFVGASRPKVNRLLSAFEDSGAIVRRGAIVQCNVPALRKLGMLETPSALELGEARG